VDSISRASDCRDADTQGVSGLRPSRVQLVRVQNNEESLCREIKEKLDQRGVSRVKAAAVVVPGGEREAQRRKEALMLNVSARTAAGKHLTAVAGPVPTWLARSAVCLWSGSYPQEDLSCDHQCFQ
jgi:hypothetical protein